MLILNPPPRIDFKKRYNEYNPVPTVFRLLNEDFQGGLRGGETGYIAGDTGMGKSALIDMFSLNAATHFANHIQDRWAFLFLLEMSIKSRIERIMQAHFRCTKGDLLNKGVVEPRPLNLIVVDENDLKGSTLSSIKEFLESQDKKPGFIAIDYIDCLDEITGGDWRAHARMSKKLEALAQNYDCPVWTGSQISVGQDFNVETELLDKRHLQGGKSKVNNATCAFSINHRGSNLVTINVFKARRGKLREFPAFVDFDRFVFEDLPSQEDGE